MVLAICNNMLVLYITRQHGNFYEYSCIGTYNFTQKMEVTQNVTLAIFTLSGNRNVSIVHMCRIRNMYGIIMYTVDFILYTQRWTELLILSLSSFIKAMKKLNFQCTCIHMWYKMKIHMLEYEYLVLFSFANESSIQGYLCIKSFCFTHVHLPGS